MGLFTIRRSEESASAITERMLTPRNFNPLVKLDRLIDFLQQLLILCWLNNAKNAWKWHNLTFLFSGDCPLILKYHINKKHYSICPVLHAATAGMISRISEVILKWAWSFILKRCHLTLPREADGFWPLLCSSDVAIFVVPKNILYDMPRKAVPCWIL